MNSPSHNRLRLRIDKCEDSRRCARQARARCASWLRSRGAPFLSSLGSTAPGATLVGAGRKPADAAAWKAGALPSAAAGGRRCHQEAGGAVRGVPRVPGRRRGGRPARNPRVWACVLRGLHRRLEDEAKQLPDLQEEHRRGRTRHARADGQGASLASRLGGSTCAERYAGTITCRIC